MVGSKRDIILSLIEIYSKLYIKKNTPKKYNTNNNNLFVLHKGGVIQPIFRKVPTFVKIVLCVYLMCLK
jgi:hypothetical protein